MEDFQISETVFEKLKEEYNLDRLCPKCGGLLEKRNEIHCEKCKILSDLRDYLTRIELGVMQIRNRIGLSANDFRKLVNSVSNFNVGGDPDDEIPNHLK